MKPIGCALLIAAMAATAACGSSARARYYTLLPPAQAGEGVAGSAIELPPVAIPAQVDMPALVVRQGGERLQPVESRQWIAPLGEEIRSALLAELGARLPASAPAWHLELEITRFESALGQYALIEADWKLRASARPRTDPLRCHSRAYQRVGESYESLVEGHQRALRALAAQIAATAQAGAASCAG